MEGKNIAGDIGQIKGCIEAIKKGQDRVTEELEGIYDRLGDLEKQGAARETRLSGIEKRMDQQREDMEREKDREASRTNFKLGVVALVFTIISFVISTLINMLV